ncbi:hypothetical protein KI387_035765, partial [Taxus chinensis]
IQPKQAVSKCEQKAAPVKMAESINYSSDTAMKTSGDHSNKSFNGTPVSSLPIPTVFPRQRTDLYYTSARSLASSHTPTPGSYLLQSLGSGRSGPSYILSQSSVDEEGLLTNLISPSPRNSKTIIRSVALTICFIGGMNYFKFPAYNNITSFSHSAQAQRRSGIIITGRKLLQ